MKISKHVILALIVAGCAASQQSAPPREAKPQDTISKTVHEPGPVGAKLIRDISASNEKYEISSGDGTGLDKYKVQLNGRSIWPPQGDGCNKLVECCTELANLADPLALSCLLATARDRNCGIAMATSAAIAQEQSYLVPKTCIP